MGIDVVDIGGAARGGVPVIPEARDADGFDDDEGELLTLPVKPEADIPDAIKKSVVPGAAVAYPNTHPAVTSGLEQDLNGGIIVPKGQSLTPKSVITTPRKANKSAVREESNKQLDELLLEEEQDASGQVGAIAKSADGTPLIEMVFHTPLGAIVSYFHKVVQSGDWLILVSYARAPAQSKFIPQPVENPDGSYMVFDISITGADKHTQRVSAQPLGLQFTVDDYDFVVMMLKQQEE